MWSFSRLAGWLLCSGLFKCCYSPTDWSKFAVSSCITHIRMHSRLMMPLTPLRRMLNACTSYLCDQRFGHCSFYFSLFSHQQCEFVWYWVFHLLYYYALHVFSSPVFYLHALCSYYNCVKLIVATLLCVHIWLLGAMS